MSVLHDDECWRDPASTNGYRTKIEILSYTWLAVIILTTSTTVRGGYLLLYRNQNEVTYITLLHNLYKYV